MKPRYGFTLIALMLGVLIWPALAQDTLLVNWQNTDGSVKINALRDAVLGDTVAGGTRANMNRVYKLMKGGYYWNTDRIENGGFALRIVGEMPGTIADENPAVLQMVRRTDGSVDQRMITGKDDLVLKNLWITGADDLGTQTAYQPIQIDASKKTFTIDNCVFDRSNFAIVAFTATGNKISFTNCKFRNLIGRPSTQQWEGRGVSVWADQDTVILENNTFFNVEFTAFQMESGAIKYLRFNHNTMVNIGRNFLTGAWWREAYFANNLIVNGFWMGEGVADYTSAGRDPRSYNAGMMAIGPLPSIYGPEEGRKILFANTAAWRDPQFKTLYGDTIREQFYVNRVTTEDFLTKYPNNMKFMDTTWLASRPNFPTYPDTLIPKMWANITDLRRGITPATPYFFDLPQLGGSECFTCVAWPLVENFTYSDASLMTAATDGLPLGDLNWFPTQKAQFEANKAQYISDLQKKLGSVPTFTVLSTLEAEKGTLSGGAAVSTFGGFSYFKMEGGGYMEWTFDLPTGGQYDLNVWTNLDGNTIRGQHTYINGTEIHDKGHGYGELIYDVAFGPAGGKPTNQWIWVTFPQDSLIEAGALTFPAGQNKIKISSSWGYQSFAGIDLLTPGTSTVVKSLRAPDATDYSIVTPKGEGAPWVPSHFKSVALGTNGTITWDTVNVPTAGTYAVQVFYQNYTGSQTASIKLDGTTVVPSVTLTSKSDSTGLNVLAAPFFPITAGKHSLSLTGSTANVDFVQLTQVVTSVGDRQGTPESFVLNQNYPNPFNPSTIISFTLPKTVNAKLMVYNVLGQLVSTLVDGQMTAGTHQVQFNARNFASGVYFYRLEAGNFVSSKKMLLVK